MKTKPKKGKPLHYPITLERRYSREIREMVRKMTKDSRKAVLSLFMETGERKDFAEVGGIATHSQNLLNDLERQWSNLFSQIAEEKVRSIITRILRESKASVTSSIKALNDGVRIPVTELTPQMKEIFRASINEGVDLIKSIPDHYFSRIKGDVMRTITTPTSSLRDLSKGIAKYGDMSYRRANNIALDQTRKAYQNFNLQMLDQVGITSGRWLHTGGSLHPRHKHKAFNNKRFDLRKGAPIGPNGEYVFPSQEPFCKCTFTPEINFEK